MGGWGERNGDILGFLEGMEALAISSLGRNTTSCPSKLGVLDRGLAAVPEV